MTPTDHLSALARVPVSQEWQPRLFDPSNPAQRAALDALLESGVVTRVADTLGEQLTDWLRAAHPKRRWTPAELAVESTRVLGGRPEEFGMWVFYPWSGVLCRVLPEDRFHFLRTARNRHKISLTEQAALDGKTIAVAGLSVGLAAATTLALEGIGRRFRLADFDTLGLSNLNRLRAGVADLGMNKAVLAARQLHEIDPYLRIELFPAGVTAGTLDAFLAPPLDLLVEECDDLPMKVRLREEARRRRIPVVMDTSDRGLVDVERFDREPDRPVFHGLIGDLRADELAGLPAADKVPFALRILDAGRLSVGVKASLPEIGQTLETWPQLASAVALGGGLVGDVARRILLGEFTESGRYSVDPATLIRDGKAEPERPATVTSPAVPAEDALVRPTPHSGVPTVEEVRYLVGHAVMAPSGGNSQPWRFEWRGGRLLGFIVPERTQRLIDMGYRGCFVALGAAAENVVLAAGELGLTADVRACSDPADPLLAWEIRLARGGRPDPLFAQVRRRATNRKTGPRIPLTAAERSALVGAVASRGGEFHLLESANELNAVAGLMGRCDRCLLMTRQGHDDTFRELRFDPTEAARTRDGLDVDLLEVPPAGRAALEVLSEWPVMARIREIGGGGALEELAPKAVAGSSAVGLLRVSGTDLAAFVAGGQAMQRLWLTATELGLSLHPWTALPYLLARMEGDDRAALSEEEQGWFTELRGDYRRLFPLDSGADVLLFRLGRAEAVAKRSLRRLVSDVLEIVP